MGFDVNRFQGPVDEELVCPICSMVLQDPVQVIINFIIFFKMNFKYLNNLIK